MKEEAGGIALSDEDGRAVRSSSGPEGETTRLAVLESISGPGIINVTNCRKPQFWSFTEREKDEQQQTRNSLRLSRPNVKPQTDYCSSSCFDIKILITSMLLLSSTLFNKLGNRSFNVFRKGVVILS